MKVHPETSSSVKLDLKRILPYAIFLLALRRIQSVVNFSKQLGKTVCKKNVERLLPTPEVLWEEFGWILAEQFSMIYSPIFYCPYPHRLSLLSAVYFTAVNQ